MRESRDTLQTMRRKGLIRGWLDVEGASDEDCRFDFGLRFLLRGLERSVQGKLGTYKGNSILR